MRMERKGMGLAATCGAILVGMAAMAAKPAATRVVVTYYHGNMRCATCMAIEARSRAAVEQYFPKELKKGTVVWQAVNFEEPANVHFLDDYQLTTKSLVLSFQKKGQEVRYKVVNEVWTHIHGDEAQYKLFVKAEVEAMFQEPAK